MTSLPSPEKKTWSFDTATKKEWEEAARREGDHPSRGTTPYYDRSDLPSESFPSLPDSSSAFAGARAWLNMPSLPVENNVEANVIARSWLNSGADGIVFELTENADPEPLLKGIELPFCNVSFLASPDHTGFFSRFCAFAKTKKYDPLSISGTIFWTKLPPQTGEVARQFSHWNRFHAIGIAMENNRQSPEDEIANLLVKAVRQINELTLFGMEIKDALNSIAFSVPVGPDFFLEIIKLKSLRILWRQITNSYLAHYSAPVFIHSVSKSAGKADYEPHGHLLQLTTSAMSAILGGSDALTLPSDDLANPRMTRITRNISSILLEESHLSKVADPTAGSYYVENRIDALARNSWKKFQQQLP